jgi:Ca-activated chloride channel family protein
MSTGFHFAEPWWFWGLLALPLVAWGWRRASWSLASPLRLYADAHLLPFLTESAEHGSASGRLRAWAGFLYWSLLWLLLLVALAGPRWELREMSLATPDDSLLVLLDLSRSMDAGDVAPSRLGRARQEIEDLIAQNRRLRLGLVAFASVPYVIAPVSEDAQGLLTRLPALSSDLARYPGSRLAPALERAAQLLAAVPRGGARALLLISDGDFDEPDLEAQVSALAEQGVVLHVLGVGTPEGSLVPTPTGKPVLDGRGQPVQSALNEPLLQALATAGGGSYQRASYQGSDTAAVLKATAAARGRAGAADGKAQVWREAFHWPLLALALLLLPQFLAPLAHPAPIAARWRQRS